MVELLPGIGACSVPADHRCSETTEGLATLTEMIEAGSIRSIVDSVYPMSEAAAAHRRVDTEQRLGAVVLGIGEPVKR